MAHEQSKRSPGSLRYQSSWRHWCEKSLDAIRFQLSQNLPHPADADAFGTLFYNLGTAADRGEMPSFADPGSRSGYALEFFCRARLLADLLFDKCSPRTPGTEEGAGKGEQNDVLYEKLKHCTDNPKVNSIPRSIHMVSLGGGPGYDYVGLLLADMFGNSGYGKTTLHGTVFDFEEGWHDLVDAMNTAISLALPNDNPSTLSWGGSCDITKPLKDLSNAACRKMVPTTDIFVCQYCVAENANRLRDSNFVFFFELFEQASNGTMFVFTEVTPRVWPDIVDILLQREDQEQGFHVKFTRGGRKYGQQMIVQKQENATLQPEELAVAEKFRDLQEVHQRKITNGFRRQPRKIRGKKLSINAIK